MNLFIYLKNYWKIKKKLFSYSKEFVLHSFNLKNMKNKFFFFTKTSKLEEEEEKERNKTIDIIQIYLSC